MIHVARSVSLVVVIGVANTLLLYQPSWYQPFCLLYWLVQHVFGASEPPRTENVRTYLALYALTPG